MHLGGTPRSPKASIGPSSDKRQACRYEASEFGAQIGWWEGADFRTHPARLVNVSQSGALVVAGASPPQGTTVGIGLEGHESTDWVEARLVGESGNKRDGYQLRLAFQDTCPYEFFKAIASFRNPSDGQGGA